MERAPFGLNEIGAMRSKRQDSWRQPGISNAFDLEGFRLVRYGGLP